MSINCRKLSPKWDPKSVKIDVKINAKIDAEKVAEIDASIVQNDAKMDPQSMQNRSIFWKSDFPKTAIIAGQLFKNRGSASQKSKKIGQKSMQYRCSKK